MYGLSHKPNSIFSRELHSQKLNKHHGHLQTLPQSKISLKSTTTTLSAKEICLDIKCEKIER